MVPRLPRNEFMSQCRSKWRLKDIESERSTLNGVDGKKQRFITSPRSRWQSITWIFGEATMKIRVIFWFFSACAQLPGLGGSWAEACLFKSSNLTDYNIMRRNQGRRDQQFVDL
jgi:hypothetical protein